MILLDGKKLSSEIKSEIAGEVQLLKKSGQRAPHLAAILVGENGASETYVASKEKSCTEVGFASTVFRLKDSITEKELLQKIIEINNPQRGDVMVFKYPEDMTKNYIKC